MAPNAAWFFLALLGLATGQGTEKRRTSNVCHIDMDCPDNAFCKANSYCVCKDGYVYAAVNSTSKGCLKEASIGDECVQHIQCHSKLGIHSECLNNVCSCKTTAHLQGSRCYNTALVGDRCVSDENCYLGDRPEPEYQAFCVRGFCTCQLLYSARDNGTRCVKDASLGEVCEDELQCAGEGLECRGTCRCKDGYVTHSFDNSCVHSVKSLGEVCDYDVQCSHLSGVKESSGAALCLGGLCSCSFNARTAGDPLRCWFKRRPGQECVRDEECVSEEDEPGYCLSGRCTCKTCAPDARDFGAASTFTVYVPLLMSAILAAILRR